MVSARYLSSTGIQSGRESTIRRESYADGITEKNVSDSKNFVIPIINS
jgi:hypothetical protein